MQAYAPITAWHIEKLWAWLGHSNSEMLDLYYHLHDDDSQRTMMELAKSVVSDLADDGFEDILRTVGEYKISNNTQVPELQGLMDVILENKNKTERPGFEPGVRTSPTQPFQGCSISHSDTSPEAVINKKFSFIFYYS